MWNISTLCPLGQVSPGDLSSLGPVQPVSVFSGLWRTPADSVWFFVASCVSGVLWPSCFGFTITTLSLALVLCSPLRCAAHWRWPRNDGELYANTPVLEKIGRFCGDNNLHNKTKTNKPWTFYLKYDGGKEGLSVQCVFNNLTFHKQQMMVIWVEHFPPRRLSSLFLLPAPTLDLGTLGACSLPAPAAFLLCAESTRRRRQRSVWDVYFDLCTQNVPVRLASYRHARCVYLSVQRGLLANRVSRRAHRLKTAKEENNMFICGWSLGGKNVFSEKEIKIFTPSTLKKRNTLHSSRVMWLTVCRAEVRTATDC